MFLWSSGTADRTNNGAPKMARARQRMRSAEQRAPARARRSSGAPTRAHLAWPPSQSFLSPSGAASRKEHSADRASSQLRPNAPQTLPISFGKSVKLQLRLRHDEAHEANAIVCRRCLGARRDARRTIDDLLLNRIRHCRALRRS